MQQVANNLAFGGSQAVYTHLSSSTATDMTFSIYVPPHAPGMKLPVVWYLSGLTCSHANVSERGEYRRACSELGTVFVAPDTSPRGKNVPDDAVGAYDFGLGAGFYVDANVGPCDENYRMLSYITEELPILAAQHFPIDLSRQSIMRHSIGGHGALTVGLRQRDRYRSVSAFSPIVAPSQVPWGKRALRGYLGQDRSAWRSHDAGSLIEDGARLSQLLVEQGTADPFFSEQLRPQLLQAACDDAGIALTLQLREGYHHSY